MCVYSERASSKDGLPSDPVLEPQALYALEFGRVVGDEDESSRTRVRGDHHVVWTDRAASPIELGADLAEVVRGRLIEGQRLDTRDEAFDHREIRLGPGGALGAEDKLAKRDAGDGHLAVVLAEAFAYLRGLVLDGVDD